MSNFPLTLAVESAPSPAEALELLAREWPMPLLFESSMQRPGLGDFSFLTADPFEAFTLVDPAHGIDPFSEVRKRMASLQANHRRDLPPFQAGAAGLLCYDLGRCWEQLPRPARDEFAVPAISIGLYDWVIAWDHRLGRCWIVSQGFPEVGSSRRTARARQRAGGVLSLLQSKGSVRETSEPVRGNADVPGTRDSTPGLPLDGHPLVQSNFSRSAYLRAVEKVIEYIRSGDIFQANLSQQLSAPLREGPVPLYRRLREANPAPFAGYFSCDDWAVLSSSPERFLSVQDGIVSTRPIKGTRSRRSIPEADLFTRDELRESRKDQAENVMIVDLLRNDLSRVCRPGTIQVPELCTVEEYKTVTHLVSEVVGQLRAEQTFWDAIAAAFPGGSITGAPKIRAMEIIDELERSARGPYCGSLLYCGFDGWADSNILIRTITCRHGQAQFPVGGGIVVGSDPAAEYEETLHKAAGMLRALEQ